MIYWFFAIIIWIGCGVVAYGGTFAYFQRQYPMLAEENYRADRFLAASTGILLGPGALIAAIMNNHFKYGLKFR